MLSTLPPGLHYDEAANGEIARHMAFEGYRPIFIPEYTGKEVVWFYGAAGVMQLVGPTIFALRLTSAWFGVAGVAAAGWLVRRLFHRDPRRDALALLCMAILATAFWLGVLSRFADRAITQPALQALSIGLLWKGLGAGNLRSQIKWMVSAGLATGLAAYTYLAVRLFPIPLAVALIALLTTDAQRRRHVVGLLVYGIAALIAVAPLGWYFLQHPQAFSVRIGQVAAGSVEEVLIGWQAALKMLFVAGDPLLRFNLPGKPIFGPALAAFFVLGLFVAWRDAVQARDAISRARGVLLIVWPVVMLAPTAFSVRAITPSNLRAVGLAPLIALYPALGIAEAAGWQRWHKGALRQVGRAAIPTALVLILFGAGALTLRDLLQWGSETALYYDNDGHVAALARYLNEDAPSNATPYLATYHYQHPTLGFLARDVQSARSLFGGEALVLAPSGETLAAYTRDALPPAEWRHRLEPYLVASPAGPDGTPDFCAYLLPEEMDFTVFPIRPTMFAGVIQLEGARLIPTQSGEVASVDLAWRILAPPPQPDLAFVVEVCDAWDWCWVRANRDGTLERGQNNTYISAQWAPGERLLTRIDVPLPQGIPPGEYYVRASIFSAQADSRLPVVDATGGYAGFYSMVPGLTIEANTQPDLDSLPMRTRLMRRITPYITLVGYDLTTQAARQGERIDLALHWLSEGRQPADADVTIRLGQATLYQGGPVHGTYPLSEWQANELITDRYALHMPVDLAAGEYPLMVRLGDSAIVGLGSIAIEAIERRFEPPPMIALDEPVIWGGKIALIGYAMLRTPAPGESVELALMWRAEGQAETSYTAFVHLIDPAGSNITQDDHVPLVDGRPYPTDLWLPREVVTDVHTLTLPTVPGEYRLRVGLYLPESGERLSVPGMPDNAFILPLTLTVP